MSKGFYRCCILPTSAGRPVEVRPEQREFEREAKLKSTEVTWLEACLVPSQLLEGYSTNDIRGYSYV